MDTFLASAVIGGIAGAVAVLSIAALMPRRHCPKCSTQLPRFRRPPSAKEAFLGGWTCHGCGTRVARDGSPAKGEAQ